MIYFCEEDGERDVKHVILRISHRRKITHVIFENVIYSYLPDTTCFPTLAPALFCFSKTALTNSVRNKVAAF